MNDNMMQNKLYEAKIEIDSVDLFYLSKSSDHEA